MMKILENKAVEVVEIQNQSQKLMISQGYRSCCIIGVTARSDFFLRPTEIVELRIETIVDFSVEPTMELASFLVVMRALIFFERSDEYNLCRYVYKS